MDLIDLISEKNSLLRKRGTQLWNATGPVRISTAEWHMLSHMHGESPTIAEVARRVELSRQAAHKSLSSLQHKGLVEISAHPHDRRGKVAALTPLGNACYAQYMQLKKQMEQEIAVRLGADSVACLRRLLEEDWLDGNIPPK